MTKDRIIVLAFVLAASMSGCAANGWQQQTVASTSVVANSPSPSAKASTVKSSTAKKSPNWKSDRRGWCRLREQQKAVARSAKDPIGGTTDPYLISVHDQMCLAL